MALCSRFLRKSSELRSLWLRPPFNIVGYPREMPPGQETRLKKQSEAGREARQGEGWKIAAIVESCESCGPMSRQRYTVARLGMKINRGGARIIPLSLRAHCTSGRIALASLNRLTRSSLSINPPLRVRHSGDRETQCQSALFPAFAFSPQPSVAWR